MSAPPDAEFDAYASGYDQALQEGLRFSGENKDYFARKRIEWLGQRWGQHHSGRPEVILDYGCGTGGSFPCLIERFEPRKMMGVDVSEASLAIASKAFPQGEFLTPEQGVPEGVVDLAFCNGVFHHIPPSERAQCVQTVYRALKPGGVFAFWENNPRNPGTRFIMSRVPFDRDAIMLDVTEARQLLEDAGFKALHADFLFIFPRLLSWLRWLEPPLASLPIGGQYLVFALKPS